MLARSPRRRTTSCTHAPLGLTLGQLPGTPHTTRCAMTHARTSAVCLLLLTLTLAGCKEAFPPEPETPTVTGEWIATRDPTRTFFVEADTFRFVLTQTDTLVSGTWGTTGAQGVVVKPIQEVSGRNVDGSIRLSLRFDRRANGCTGPERECFELYWRVFGEFRTANEIHARVIGMPHPTIPDSELPPLAEWTLRRQ